MICYTGEGNREKGNVKEGWRESKTERKTWERKTSFKKLRWLSSHLNQQFFSTCRWMRSILSPREHLWQDFQPFILSFLSEIIASWLNHRVLSSSHHVGSLFRMIQSPRYSGEFGDFWMPLIDSLKIIRMHFH